MMNHKHENSNQIGEESMHLTLVQHFLTCNARVLEKVTQVTVKGKTLHYSKTKCKLMIGVLRPDQKGTKKTNKMLK